MASSVPDPTSRNGVKYPSRSATFAEQRHGAPVSGGDVPAPPRMDDEAIRAQWRVLARLATGVAILTSPVFFLVFYRVLGWGVLASVIVTVLAVAAFRGLFDLVTRRLIPAPGTFHEDAGMRAEDITARRRLWFWRFWYRLAAALVVIWLVAALIVYVVDAVQGDASVTAALKAPFEWIGDQVGGADFSAQLIGFFLTVVLIFFVNVIIFLGPLLFAGIRQIKAYEPGDADWGVRFDDVRGQDRPKDEVRKIVRLWQAGQQFESAGGKRERGLLFVGAPGTGKTMLAKAVASGFNCPFVSVPGPAFSQTFIGVDVILVMWMSWRARRLARKWGGQCIVFIDEIDALGTRFGTPAGLASARASLHDHCFFGPMGSINPSGDLIVESEAWRERLFRERAPQRGSVYPAGIQRFADRVREYVTPGFNQTGTGGLQQLLVVMDGVGTPGGLRRFLTNRTNTFLDALYIVPTSLGRVRLRIPPARPAREELYFIGATNAPTGWLDPALTRPGRMGRHVYFRTPNKDDRKDIIDLYLGKVAHEADLDRPERREEIARITMGHSPAMIEQVCSLALMNAHHAGRGEAGRQDLLEAIVDVEFGLESGFTFVPDEARAIAVHEAGHAITGHAFMKDHMSTRLTITPRGSSGGHHQMREIEERFARWQHEEFAELVWSLGAMAAELVFYGETGQGVGGDIAGATYDAAMMVGSWGMAPRAPELGDRFPTRGEAAKAERKLMRRYEQVGLRIMNRATIGSARDGDPVASVLSDPAKRAMVAQLLGQALLSAFWCVRHNQEATDRLASTLVERRALYGDEVVDILDGLNVAVPDVDPLDEASWPRI